jgi:hypothetical protein
MKLKKNFVLRQLAGAYMVLPLGQETVSFGGMLKLNESGALLWNALKNGEDLDGLVKALTAEYAVSEAQAREDVKEFLDKLAHAGCLEM